LPLACVRTVPFVLNTDQIAPTRKREGKQCSLLGVPIDEGLLLCFA
jgi:hypothetical protein